MNLILRGTDHALRPVHKALDPKLNSFITLTEESTIAEARRCDDRLLGRGAVPSSWFSIPIAPKGNIDIAGLALPLRRNCIVTAS